MNKYKIQIKRVYEISEKADGFRVLVDRLWPRGVSKDKAAIDLWVKDIAPSTELREWFGHKPELFKEFSVKYKQELSDNFAVSDMLNIVRLNKTVTLVYAAKDEKNNHAIVLKKYLEQKLK